MCSYFVLCRVALNGFATAAAAAAAPASPVLNGPAHAAAFSQSTPAVYGTSAFFQLGSPSAAAFPAVRLTLSVRFISAKD